MVNIIIIIQARVSSTRYPNKILRPFAGKSILSIQLDKLKQLSYPIVVATSTNQADDAIESVCREMKIACTRGSEQDVLARFMTTLHDYPSRHVIRICSDNPFLDLELLELMIEKHLESGRDYTSYSYNDTPVMLTHFGFFAEIVTFEALQKLDGLSKDKDVCREHVTNCLYTDTENFSINFIPLDETDFSTNKIRLTIDTPEDFSMAETIFIALEEKQSTFNYKDVITYLNDNEDILAYMENQINRNSK